VGAAERRKAQRRLWRGDLYAAAGRQYACALLDTDRAGTTRLSLHEVFGRAGAPPDDVHILDEHEIADGIDELGVLLYGHKKNAYWYGSQLSIDETREVAPYQNATGLQVTSAVIAGMVWALENPKAGIVETDEMDFRRCLEVQLPYLGPVIGTYTDWTPLTGRPGLFPEDIDKRDPWQFRNVLLH
jgi:homospermidine synthase